MSRRQGVTWAATSVPDVRRQWCNALDQTVERFSEGLAPPAPGTAGAGNRRLERTQAKLATEIEPMKAENDALRGAELFWVARDMVDVVVSVLKLNGGWRRTYLHVCRILIKMADSFFSSSWRILELYGSAQTASETYVA